MQETDFKEFSTKLAALAVVYDKPMTRDSVKLYFLTLQDLPISQVIGAFNHLARTSKWFPKPAEIRDAITGDVAAMAAIAYDRFLKALESVGTYQTVIFDDPVIHAVVQAMGGWVELGQKQFDEWTRKEFERLYIVYKKNPSPEATPLRLVGRIEAHNGAHGYKVPEPVLIGDGEKIQRWQISCQEHKSAALEGNIAGLLSMRKEK